MRKQQPIEGKLPPQAVELEEAILGAMLLENDAIPKAASILQAEDFYTDQNKTIYHHMMEMFSKSLPVDILTVVNYLKVNGKLDLAGGGYYINLLSNRVAGSANIEYHSMIVKEKAVQRNIIRVCNETLHTAYETNDVFGMLDGVRNSLDNIGEVDISGSFIDAKNRMAKTMEKIKKGINQSGVTGVPCGLTSIDRFTGGFQEGDLIFIGARPGNYKCLGKGTLVMMFDGELKKVEDISVGDKLMGIDSTPRNVLSCGSGFENMYYVKQKRGITYRVNESHILSLKRSRTEWKHKNGDVLNIGLMDYINSAKKFKSNYKGYKCGLIEFKENALTLDPYYLGLWLGDGHSRSNSITIGDEPDLISYLEEYAEKLSMKVSFRKDKRNNCGEYTIINKNKKGNHGKSYVVNQLQSLGVIKNKHIPKDYLVNSEKNRLELLAGMIDTDGYLNQYGYYTITQKNESLIMQFKQLCDFLGFKTGISKYVSEIKSSGFKGEYFVLSIYGDVGRIPCKIKRKQCNKTRSNFKNALATGIEVVYDKYDEYFGFEIDGDRLFMLEDGTVTHNTALIMAMAHKMIPLGFTPYISQQEMALEQSGMRELAMHSGVNTQDLRRGVISDFELAKLEEAAEKVAKMNVYIDHTGGMKLSQIKANVKKQSKIKRIDILFVDYLQLLNMETKGNYSSDEAVIAATTRKLKLLAKDLHIPVVALSQLSRQVESRPDKRPVMSDFKGSGAIEADADIAILLFNPSKYFADPTDDKGNSMLNKVEVIFCKNRQGQTGSIILDVNPATNTFNDIGVVPHEAKTMPRNLNMADDMDWEDVKAPF